MLIILFAKFKIKMHVHPVIKMYKLKQNMTKYLGNAKFKT